MPLSSLIPALIGGALGSAGSAPQPSQVPEPTAVVRALPQEAKKGVLTPPLAGSARIDGNTLPLAPGLQVRNERNLIVMPGTLQQPVSVRYQTDQVGAVFRVWVLTPQEAAAR
jgi:hypothetical protein